MNISDLRYKRNNALQQAVDILKKDKSAEARARASAFSAEADALDQQIKLEERLTESRREEERAGRPPRSNPSRGQVASNDAEIRSFERYIRTGRIDDTLETRAIGEGAVAGNLTVSAGVAVPTGVGDLTIVQKSLGNLAAAVKQLVTDAGQPIRLPIVDDTANDLVDLAELADQGEVDPAITSVLSSVDDLSSGLVVISNQLLQDSAFSVSDMVTEIFNTRLIKGLNKRVYSGNGNSFDAITTAAPVKVTTASPMAIQWSELTGLYGSLDVAYRTNASWVISSATHSYLLAMTDNYGHPILQPDVHGTPFMSLLGRPVVIAETAPSVAAGNAPILFGDLSTYVLRSVRNPTILRLNERFATQNATGFILFARAGGRNLSQASSPSMARLAMHA
jgi:HK97 family phage major capsid protein